MIKNASFVVLIDHQAVFRNYQIQHHAAQHSPTTFESSRRHRITKTSFRAESVMIEFGSYDDQAAVVEELDLLQGERMADTIILLARVSWSFVSKQRG